MRKVFNRERASNRRPIKAAKTYYHFNVWFEIDGFTEDESAITYRKRLLYTYLIAVE